MNHADSWAALVRGDGCPMCAANALPEADEPRLVATLPSGRVLLQDDADFRGYCMLTLRSHVVELFELPEPARGALMEDVARLAAAIAAECRPAKLNYAALGNECPHLHVHVTPRYPHDGWWGRPIWSRPADQRRALAPADYAALRAALRQRLTAGI